MTKPDEGGTEELNRGNRAELVLALPIIEQMQSIGGWLEREDADILIAATLRALSIPGSGTIVEIGSYYGKSTYVLGSVIKAVRPQARVYAIDPHEGTVSVSDQQLSNGDETITIFLQNMRHADLQDIVIPIRKHSHEVAWDKPISFLFVDGLHDYENVSRDFRHFESWIVERGLVAFHDYSDYYPGVVRYVNEILRGGRYTTLGRAASTIVLEKVRISPYEPQKILAISRAGHDAPLTSGPRAGAGRIADGSAHFFEALRGERPKKAGWVREEWLAEGVRLRNADTEQTLALNATATLIWDYCDGRHDVASIAAELRELFPDAPDAEWDFVRLLHRLMYAGMLTTEQL